jgi:hypothetical protein
VQIVPNHGSTYFIGWRRLVSVRDARRRHTPSVVSGSVQLRRQGDRRFETIVVGAPRRLGPQNESFKIIQFVDLASSSAQQQ